MGANDNLVVDSQWLLDNFEHVKIIDASQVFGNRGTPSEFQEKYYGQFEKISRDFVNRAYEDEHIPGAAHFSFDVGYFPSKYIKFDLYPPEIFQKYLRLLGINQSDHVVIYSQGPAAGMLFASRTLWTFQTYGIKNISVLNGGLDAWKKAGGKVTNQKETFSLGDFSTPGWDRDIYALFEDIPFNHFSQGQIEYVDARSTAQFTGEEPLNNTFPGTTAKGSHLTGAKSLPIVEVIGPNGFKSRSEVDQIIEKLGLDKDQKIYVGCNTGVQASVIYTALTRSGIKAAVYNGSMQELAYRAPELVNASGPATV